MSWHIRITCFEKGELGDFHARSLSARSRSSPPTFDETMGMPTAPPTPTWSWRWSRRP